MNVDVFISYAHNGDRGDAEFVETLQHKLLQAEIPVVWTDKQIQYGQNWANEISQALSAARMVVLVMSRESMMSAYVTYEWCYAHFALNKHIYPIHLGGCGPDTGVFGCFNRTQLQRKELQHPTDTSELEELVADIKEILSIPPNIQQAGEVLIEGENSREKRQAAAKELGQSVNLASVGYLLEGLKHEIIPGKGDGEVQEAIVQALYSVGQKRDIPTIALLCRLLNHTTDTSVHVLTLQTIAKLTE